MTLTLNLQGQIRNLLYLSQKWSDCHKAKKKHIDRTQALKCGLRVWPWPWPWPRIFKVQHGICYISTKSGPKVRCKDLPDSDWGDFRCRRAIDSSNFFCECLEKTDRVITAPHCTVYYKKCLHRHGLQRLQCSAPVYPYPIGSLHCCCANHTIPQVRWGDV